MNYYKYYLAEYEDDKLIALFGFDDMEHCKRFFTIMVKSPHGRYEIIQVTRLGIEVIERYE